MRLWQPTENTYWRPPGCPCNILHWSEQRAYLSRWAFLSVHLPIGYGSCQILTINTFASLVNLSGIGFLTLLHFHQHFTRRLSVATFLASLCRPHCLKGGCHGHWIRDASLHTWMLSRPCHTIQVTHGSKFHSLPPSTSHENGALVLIGKLGICVTDVVLAKACQVM